VQEPLLTFAQARHSGRYAHPRPAKQGEVKDGQSTRCAATRGPRNGIRDDVQEIALTRSRTKAGRHAYYLSRRKAKGAERGHQVILLGVPCRWEMYQAFHRGGRRKAKSA